MTTPTPTSPCTAPRTIPQQAAAGLLPASPQPGRDPRLQDRQRDPRPEGERTPVATLVVLVPAYRPDHRLPDLVRQVLRRCSGCAVLVVDDGSGPDYAEVFATVRSHGAHVITLARNRGKGEALRMGGGCTTPRPAYAATRQDSWPGSSRSAAAGTSTSWPCYCERTG